jgi:tetratricopeptide (TPR) repeat protein
LPPALSAWLILYRIRKALLVLDLSLEIRGDIMMAFECSNFVLPEKTLQAARHLAHALCLMPLLGRARTTLHNLGCPYDMRNMSEEEIDQLVRQGYLPQDVQVSSNGLMRLGWNIEMRQAVAGELQTIHPDLRRLFQLDRLQEKEQQALRRWKTRPKQEAAALLQKGMDAAGQGQFAAAVELLDNAGDADPILLPDVLRNKAWILMKQKQYTECADRCRQALEIDSEYAEVWYQLGICLAQSGRYGEALKAYEKAKSLGFRSSGLEPNMKTCRHAIADGFS